MLTGDMLKGFDGGHRNAVFASGRDFFSPRTIHFASDIPPIGRYDKPEPKSPIRLRGVVDDGTASFVAAHGAVRDAFGHWLLPRSDPFPFDALHAYLPRFAHRSVTPDIVDLIPRRAWYASLARLMVAGAWSKMTAFAWSRQRVCYECGGFSMKTDPLDGHEVWWYNAHEVAGYKSDGSPILGVRRLLSVRMLCGRCHEMMHLGNSDKRGRFRQAFERLGMINRIDWRPHPHGEAGSYKDEIYDKYKSRNRRAIAWNLDLAAAAGSRIQLHRNLVHIGDGVIVKRGKDDVHPDDENADVVVRIINADIRMVGGHVWVEPSVARPVFV